MTQKALAAIAEAETQAEVLCRVAEEKATEMKNKIKTEGEAHCARVKEEATRECEDELATIKAHAERLGSKKREDAKREADDLIALARERMDEAVKTIVWGIIEKCQ